MRDTVIWLKMISIRHTMQLGATPIVINHWNIFHWICTRFCCFLCTLVVSRVPVNLCDLFSHIFQGCFVGVGAISPLPVKYGSMGQIWSQQNMTLHERHVVSAYVDSLCGPTSKKRQSPHNWPFVMGITGEFPAQRACNAKKKLPFDDVIMKMWNPCIFFWDVLYFGETISSCCHIK